MESLMFWDPYTDGLGFLANDEKWKNSLLEEQGAAGARLLRPLGYMENGLATAHTYGSSNIVYALRMHGRQPVRGHDVRRALTIVQSRIQNLRLCIREAFGRRHFAEMRAPRLLFRVEEADDWMQEYEHQLQVIFDTEAGPLWSATLLTLPGVNGAKQAGRQPAPAGPAQGQGGPTAPAGPAQGQGGPTAPEAAADADDDEVEREANYPFESMLVLTFCHAISDGSSNARFCHRFLRVLNQVIEGAAVDGTEDVKLGAPLEGMSMRGGIYTVANGLRLAKSLYQLLIPPTHHYLTTFPPPKGSKEIRMRTYSMNLNRAQTSQFMTRSKMEGVSVHAAFTVAASIALHELIRLKRPEMSALNVRSGHVVNFRRYFPADQQDAFGCYMGFFEAEVPATLTSRGRFWKLARDTVVLMKNRLDEEMQPVTYCKCMQTFIDTERWVHSQHTKEMPHVSHYFGTSNMGNLDRLFDASGKHVQVTQMVRTTNIGHDLGMVFAHMFHTLRGRLMYNLDYLAAAITEPQARDYAEKTIEILISVSLP